MHYEYRLTLFESHPKYISSLQWYILYCDSENNGTTIFDFLTNRTNVHEAHITYPLPSPTLYILVVRYQGFTRVDHSKTTQSNFSSSGTILQGRFRLSRFERFTYDVSTHTCARSSLAFTSPSSSCRHGCSSRGQGIDPIGPGFTTTEGFGLQLSRISLKDFRRVDGGPRRHPRRRRRGNEEAAQLVGFEGDDPEERGRRILSEGKKIFIGPMVAWRKRRGSSRKWRSGWKVHWWIARDIKGVVS